MNDFELALQLQKQFNEEAEKIRKEEEASVALALKLQQDEQRAFESDRRPLPTQPSVPNRQNQSSFSNVADRIIQERRNKQSELPLPAWDPTSNVLAFSQGEETVEYDRATLSMNFLTKEYSLMFSQRRQHIIEEAPKLKFTTTYTEIMATKSISQQELVREVTLRSSSSDPVEIRYVASSLKQVDPDQFYLVNRLAAKVFVYNNNKSLRNYLINEKRSKPVNVKKCKHQKTHNVQPILSLDLHGLFVSEARERVMTFFSLCFSKRIRRCRLCVGIGRTFSSRLRDTVEFMLRKLSTEAQFSKRAVITYERENDGLLLIKLNLDCVALSR